MIRVGLAGWAYKDWNGVVYPEPRPRRFDPLAYLAGYFQAIEINSTYYGPPRAVFAKRWLASIESAPAFRFTAKLFHSFTHERHPAPNDEKDFKDGIAPIFESGRLGALLLQFPWSFKNTPDNRAYLTALCRRFGEFPLVLEVRHSSWTTPETLDLLTALGVGLSNIDQPLFQRSVKPGQAATSCLGYVRLHGRNYQNWFSEKADVRQRYDYLYSARELEPWADRVKAIAAKTKSVFVISNNHNIGKAATNSLQLLSLLAGRRVPAPFTLFEHYRKELEDFAQPKET